MTARTILVVDDDTSIRKLILGELGRLGHQVTGAGNGREAIAALGRLNFEVVITDIVMPERDGFEVMATVRRTQPHARLIAMSGGGMVAADSYLQNAHGLGADAIIEKPFTMAELGNVLKQVLGV